MCVCVCVVCVCGVCVCVCVVCVCVVCVCVMCKCSHVPKFPSLILSHSFGENAGSKFKPARILHMIVPL